jgi:hypothetical protein
VASCGFADSCQVNEVYEMMSRADATIQQMPAIIARLQSLRPLHEESLTFSQTLRHLHNQQSQIVHMLSSHNAHLIKVRALSVVARMRHSA